MPLARKHKRHFSYADYLQWDDTVRAELIEGEVYDMTPAPSRKHQEVSMALSVVFGTYLKGRKCRAFAAPFDVRLPGKSNNDSDITTVVQPDLSIICDEKKLDARGCLGAPDLIVEKLSPETAAKDMREKTALYEKHGVNEYWIIHPLDKTVMVFHLDGDGTYARPVTYSAQDRVRVKTLKGFAVGLSEIV